VKIREFLSHVTKISFEEFSSRVEFDSQFLQQLHPVEIQQNEQEEEEFKNINIRDYVESKMDIELEVSKGGKAPSDPEINIKNEIDTKPKIEVEVPTIIKIN
jgi:hypothetical protein